jgi:amidase
VAVSGRSPVRGVRTAPEHLRALDQTAARLRDLGHEIREIDPHYPDLTAVFGPQFYGGVRAEAALVEHPELLERRTRQTLRLGRPVPDSAVAWAVRRGERLAARVNEVFERADVLLTPALAARPHRLGALDGAGSVRASLRALPYIAYTAVWNVCGNPAASLPVGFADDGLPLAVQLVARPHDEVTLLRLAAQFEHAHPWAAARPEPDVPSGR